MKLKEARNLGIKHCEENNVNYTYISHDEASDFYPTNNDGRYTVFIVNRNGSLNAYRNTKYAVDFHKELNKRRKNRRKNDKRKIADICNQDEGD
jgi:hypothetical protein